MSIFSVENVLFEEHLVAIGIVIHSHKYVSSKTPLCRGSVSDASAYVDINISLECDIKYTAQRNFNFLFTLIF